MPERDSATRSSDPAASRLVATLTLAGLISGIAIASVHEMTLPRIEANKAAALREAVFHVVPGADSMQTCTLDDGHLVTLGATQDTPEQAIYATYDAQGTLLGYAIPADGPGFQDAIRLIFGFDAASQHIVGLQVLESRETPGLGDKIVKDAHFLDNFTDLEADVDIKLVKNGAKSQANEVDAITGATISSRAVVRILNGSLQTWRAALQDTAPAQEAGR